jgi:DNA-binding NtrC family response regulator
MTQPRQIVFVVDDDPAICVALKRLIRSVGIEVQTFASAQEFLSAIRPEVPACLVLDVRLPDLSGLNLQEKLTDAKIDLPIIFITGHGDIPMTVRAMKGGALEFLTKPVKEQDLLEAIQRGIEQHRHHLVQRAEASELQRRYDSLTPREREVFPLVTSGLLNKQIAAELGASEKTIKIHRGQVMQKMKAESLAHLVRMVEKLGLTPSGTNAAQLHPRTLPENPRAVGPKPDRTASIRLLSFQLKEIFMGSFERLQTDERDERDRQFDRIVGNSPALELVLAEVQHVAPTDSTVLVQGETGTGKELIAHAIHNLSARRGRPFVKLNCAAIPFDLLESELFGHEKGAFTGAIAQKIGRFEMADTGTLFLDEIGDIPLALQPKLLRVLQEKEFERLGSGRTHYINVRLVAPPIAIWPRWWHGMNSAVIFTID